MAGKDAGQDRRRAAGALEGEILAALWATDDPLTPRQVRAALGGGLAYNTVHTILTRLWDKGLVVRDAQGRRGTYRPAVQAVEHTAEMMHDLLERGPDRLEVLQRFVTGLNDTDERALREMLADLADRGDPGVPDDPEEPGARS